MTELKKDSDKTGCLTFERIDHCFKYNSNSDFKTSTLECIECESEYYLNN